MQKHAACCTQGVRHSQMMRKSQLHPVRDNEPNSSGDAPAPGGLGQQQPAQARSPLVDLLGADFDDVPDVDETPRSWIKAELMGEGAP